jgi:hypothetical protein
MDPCCAVDLESGFDERVAARDLSAYRRNGLPPDQRRLLGALVADGVGERTVLMRIALYRPVAGDPSAQPGRSRSSGPT